MSEHEFDETTIEDAAKAGRAAWWDMPGKAGTWDAAGPGERAHWRRVARAVLASVAFIITSLRRTVDVMAAEIVALKESGAVLIRERNEAKDRELTLINRLHAVAAALGDFDKGDTLVAAARIMAEVVTLRAQRRAVEEFVAAYTRGATTLPLASTGVCAARHVAATQAGVDDGAVPCVGCEVGEREQRKPEVTGWDSDGGRPISGDIIADIHVDAADASLRANESVIPSFATVDRMIAAEDAARGDDGPGPANEAAKWKTPERMVRASEAYADRSANTFATAVGIVHERDRQVADLCAAKAATARAESKGCYYAETAATERGKAEAYRDIEAMLRGGAS